MAELQQWSTQWLANVAEALPLGYAFGAGMVSTVNPCGFAILPAYLGLYLGSRHLVGGRSPRAEPFGAASTMAAVSRQVAQAVVVSLTVTGGFVLLFGGVGLVISAGGRLILGLAPWIAVVIGALLVVLGLATLRGAHVSAGFAARLADRVGDAGSVTLKGFLLFGVAFGLASLSCTLPIFLTVVGVSLAVEGFAAAALQFVSYALGMGFVILVLTIALGVFKGGLLERLRWVLPRIERASALLLIFAGGYILYYWLFKGGLIDVLLSG